MELIKACEELAKIIKDGGHAEIIESFIISLDEGETPAMALAMAKNSDNLSEDAYCP